VSTATFDVVVVGAGPAGSIAALVLARGGARVALVDKATFARDKACGDLIGPRALALMTSLGLTPPEGRQVGEMVVVGPSGRRVVLPARAGRTYPDHGLAIPRARFDNWLRDQAISAGAEPVTGRVGSARGGIVALDDGRRLVADIVVGADGANSRVASDAGLIDPAAVLWGFAQRSYVDQAVDRPVIVLWDDARRNGFPGYGWVFPGEAGVANLGLGLGLRADRSTASRAITQFDSFCDHLRRIELLSASVDRRRLGGWLKMGMVGTIAARDRTFLVGDAAGLVNPLQGEGIAPAMTSAALAAVAILAGPGTAAVHYRRLLDVGPGRFAAAASPLHHAAINGSPTRVALLGRVLTLPVLRTFLAPIWALSWNDLLDGAPPGPTTVMSRLALASGRFAGRSSSIGERLRLDLADL
jgi:geranylgeranyl reductase family protein